MSDVKRMTRSEQNGLFDLLTAANCCEGVVTEKMKARLDRMPMTCEKMVKARDLVLEVCNDVLASAPTDQLLHLKRQIKHLKHRIWIGTDIFGARDDAEVRYFDINEQNTIAKAIREKCAVCPYDNPQDQRSCEYKKLLDKLSADPDASGEYCGWFTLFGRLD